MAFHFAKHYTLSEARALLPKVQQWFAQLDVLRAQLAEDDAALTERLSAGCDVGGAAVNRTISAISEIKDLLLEFQSREIQIKDLDRGLIDFPALRDGREVFLCWEKGEEDIEFWHDLESGYPGREPL